MKLFYVDYFALKSFFLLKKTIIMFIMDRLNRFFAFPDVPLADWTAVQPLAVGYKSCRELTANVGHSYRSYHFVEKGTITAQVGPGRGLRLGRGETFLIPSRTAFWYRAESEGARLWWIRLAGEGADAFCRALHLDRENWRGKVSPEDGPGVLAALKAMADLSEAPGETWLPQSVELLYRLLGHHRPPVVSGPGKRRLSQDVLDYLGQENHLSLTVEETARKFGLTRSGLFALFKRERGCSPREAMGAMRLDRAVELLKRTDLSVKEVAFASGYPSELAFYRRFRDGVGRTPSQFRKDGVLQGAPGGPSRENESIY